MEFIKILFLSTFAFSRTELVELTTKQNIQTLKYFYKKDDSNFYMKGKDSLAFSSNYKSIPVLTDKIASEYGVATANNNIFLVWKKFDSHRMLAPNSDAEIYLFEVKTKSIEKLGKGVSPKFLRDGRYISYYSMAKKEIVVINRYNRAKTYRIKVNSKSPYYIPSYVLSDLDSLYYTDTNDKMLTGILKVDLDTKKRETLYKTNQYSINLELCSTKDNLYILESASGTDSFTNLYKLSFLEKDISKRDFLFQSSKGPAHSMICDNSTDSIFMIKTLKGLSGNISEVISYNMKEKKAYVHSDLKFVTSLLQIEEKLYIPFRKKVFLLDGKDGKLKLKKELVERDD